MAIRLRQRGIDDFVILERAADLGGTWRDNQYPGCACDVASSLYSFSFAPNPSWSRIFSTQPEIRDYLRRCVARYDIGRHIVFGEDVTRAVWDGAAQAWDVTSTTRRWQARVLIAANGQLSDPAIPALPGLETFAGPAFHSSRWDHAVDLRGKRVAVIGTGASAIQFVPRIQPLVDRLVVFQRTPPWILPRHDREVPRWRRALYRAVPAAQRLERGALYAIHEVLHIPFHARAAGRIAEWIARRQLTAQVADPALRARLTPDYAIGCKRVLFSRSYYPALTQPNVTLVTEPAATVRPDAVLTADGTAHPADVVIFSTGFRTTDPPLAEHIEDGTGRTLADAWQGSPRAYRGTAVSGFPNLFLLMGPNTGLGHSSVLLMLEAQIAHVLGVLGQMAARGARVAEPRAEAQDRYVAWLDARLASTVWNRGGCTSWYLDRTGRNSILWPDRVGRFRRSVSHVVPDDYILR